MDQKEDGASRWWEFYAVRYGMGTVVGGIIFFFLCFSTPTLKPLLNGAESGKLDATQLVLLAAYGLAYCYIASAPILVLHVGRFLLDVRPKRAFSGYRLVVTFAPALLASAAYAALGKQEGDLFYLLVLAVFLAVLLLWVQGLVVFGALSRSKDLLSFYQKLANKRSAAKGGLVDSYRHMREHGNSFFIVVFEIALAVLLFTAGSPPFTSFVGGQVTLSVLIVFVWVLPAALVWLVGTVLEREFSGA